MPTWQSTSLDSVDQADAVADKPLILSQNVVTSADTVAWDGTTDTSFPTTRVYDGYQHIGTRPTAAAATTYLEFTFASPVTFDSISILDRFKVSGDGALVGSNITVDIADDSGLTNLQNIVTRTVVAGEDDRRNLFLVPSTTGSPTAADAEVFSVVNFLRIGFLTGNATTLLMNVGEVIIGVRNQLRRDVLSPGSKDTTGSRTATFDAQSGVQARYVYNKGQAIREASFIAYGSSEATKFKNWWSQIGYGSLPFIYCENPSAENIATGYYMQTDDSVFPFARQAAATEFQQGKISMSEMAPFVSQE